MQEINKKESVIILAARNQLSVGNYSSQMFPVHGKPALFWIIDSYQGKNTVVVLNERNKILKNYIDFAYPEVTCVLVSQSEMYRKYGQYSVLTSFFEGMVYTAKDSDGVFVVLGDTYSQKAVFECSDYILTSEACGPSEKWCLVSTDGDGCVKEFYDKSSNVDLSGKQIVTGIYHFSDAAALRKCAADVIKEKREELSDLVASYNMKIKVRCIFDDTWLDFGHRAGLIKAQRIFYNSRNFNAISADAVTNILTKRSAKKQKLSDEYLWYKQVPAGLQSFVPRVYAARADSEIFELDMENYGYPPLSELWLYGDYDVELWQLITKKLIDMRLYMNEFTGALDFENYEQLYVSKFYDRIAELKKLSDYWKKLLDQETITVNKIVYKNLPFYEKRLRFELGRIAASAETSVMHGDYCFSNILFDTQNFVCKLIDPRGRLLNQTVYGDSRYDLAKLRHSLAGNYDYIVHGVYQFSEAKEGFFYKDGCLEDRSALVEYFDGLLTENAYDVREIKIIEATLFLSMIPLHTDSLEQQKIFYIKGIQKLNECFGDK